MYVNMHGVSRFERGTRMLTEQNKIMFTTRRTRKAGKWPRKPGNLEKMAISPDLRAHAVRFSSFSSKNNLLPFLRKEQYTPSFYKPAFISVLSYRKKYMPRIIP